MVLYSAPTDAKVGGDVLTGVASEDQFRDLALSWSQPGDVIGRGLLPSKQLVGQLVPFTKQSLFSGESFLQQDFCQLDIIARDHAPFRTSRNAVRK